MNNEKLSRTSYSTLLILIYVITLIHWLVLIFQIPILNKLPYWDYKLHITPLNFLWIFLAFITFGLAILLSFSKSSYAVKVIGIILLGTALQYCFAFSKGDGLDALSAKMTGQGHAEFAKVTTVQQVTARSVVMDYENLISEKYYQFLPSKPPGTLLFYIVTNEVTEIFLAPEGKRKRLENFATFASLTWPFISSLALIPIFFLTRYLFDDREAGIIASLFYISIPSLHLITMVTDQTLYPFLAVCSVLLVVISFRYNSLMLAFLSGVFFYIVLYFSFGMAVIAFLYLSAMMAALPELTMKQFTIHIRHLVVIGLGVIASGIFAYYFTNYNFFVRYEGAIAHHLQWKKWENNLETYFNSSFTNLTEFAIWIGLPLTILFLMSFSDSIGQFIARKPTRASFYNATLALTFIFLLIFGKTKAETARLWLFLMPFLCISTADFINRQNWTNRNKITFTVTVLFLQIGTTYLTLHYQDFG